MPLDALTEINTAMDAAVVAQAAGDYRAALVKVESAWMRLCALPDSEFSNERLEWSRESLKSLMDWLQKRANAQAAAESSAAARGSLIRPSEVTYKRG